MVQATSSNTSAANLDHYAIDEVRFNRLVTVAEAIEGLARLTHDGTIATARDTAPVGREALSAIFQLLANELSAISSGVPLAETIRH